MNSTIRSRAVRLAGVFCSFALLSLELTAQQHTFTGVNPPGTEQDFQFNVSTGVTNLAISVTGSSGEFSHLLLQKVTAPDDTDYAFLAAMDGQSNAINLELSQLTRTNYFLRVRTPSNSLEHAFTVTVSTNVSGLRTLALPATKPLVSTNQGSLLAGGWHYYRVEVPASSEGWRILLNAASNTGPDLYIQTNALPATSSWVRRSLSQTNDVILFSPSELAPGAYFIGVNQPVGSNAYTLRTELVPVTTLTWDPGATHEGTEVYTSADTNGGDYFFKITTANTALGAWRTALNVVSGEAAIYLTKGTLPGPTNSLYKSERVGSDGFVVSSSAFNPGEVWYYTVRATPGSHWNLVSGEPFVTDLGTVATNASSGSGDLAVGAEGIRFFQTTVPVNGVAWRLWLNGLPNTLMVKKASVPLPGASDLTQPRQMLVVPGYLVGGLLYFVGVSGDPGSIINLDSRQQSISDIPFSSTTNVTVTGFGYTTFRVQVPADQLAWQISVAPVNGNPNVAVRRNFIPNENNNDAYSEVASNVTDSITLVPPTLSDGTFFITVYGTNTYSCLLQSGTPEFTEINFTSSTINADTNRVGWRFFKVSNIGQQLGALGWDLFVTNYAPGTRIALRRNAAPGIWNFRNPSPGANGSYDFLSSADYLQRPGHQADVWYVGVYNNSNALGAFTLVTRELTADPLAMDGGSASRSAVPPDKWQFFRVDVPANALGWDVRLTDVTSGRPQLVVRRELLPISLANIGFSSTVTATNWVTGNQWLAASDWTDRSLSSDGSIDESGRILTMGYGRPIDTGTYYIGVMSAAGASNAISYTLVSRGIGPGFTIPVQDIDFAGGSATNNALGARDIAVYRVTIPTNTPSWKVRLGMTSGDALLAIAKDRVPNITAGDNGGITNYLTAGKKMLKAGNEHHVQLPAKGQTNLFPGIYYLVVASEGQTGVSNTTRIGTGSAGYVLQSRTLPEIDLGLLDMNDILHPFQLEGGEAAALHFHNHPFPTTLGFELSLSDRTGNPVMVTRSTMELADPGAPSTGGGGVTADFYGNDGGQADFLQASGGFITASGVFEDETVMLMARKLSNTYPDATATLKIRRLFASPLAFDGGTSTVSGQTNIYEFYRVEVPANALGWDLRLTNVLAGSPKLIISRDYLPLNIVTTGWDPGKDTYWPSGANWIASKDWTQRSLSADGSVNEDGRILAMGMGRPLEPGTYYVAVYNPNFPSPASYTIASRGIGDGYSIPVVDVPFAGGSVTNSGLLPREAAYYRVIIPPESTSWRAKLTTVTGEAMFALLTNNVPSVETGLSGSAGLASAKSGNELFVRLPFSPQTSLSPLTNYFAVVSEGVLSGNVAQRIGSGPSSFVLESRGPLPITDLGTLGTTDVVYTATLEGADVHAYQFNVPLGINSLELELQNKTGNPVMVVRAGSPFPNPGAASSISGAGSVSAEAYGNEGGYTITANNGNANSSLITLPNPTNGIHTVMVKARGIGGVFTNAGYTLVVRATTYTSVGFDGGNAVVTNQTANTWRYYRVDVPPDALGWDIRLANVTAGLPRLVVRRDLIPKSLVTTPWGSPGVTTNWPSTNQWAASSDWTHRPTSANGLINEEYRILAMGMGQPLEPGTYYIGVINNAGTNAMSYTLLSRGIGNGLSIPVTELSYAGGSETVTNLPPREAAYFRVQVPANSPGWKVKLGATAGECMMVVLSNCVPNVDSGWLTGARNGKLMQTAGDEHYLLLPPATQTNMAGLGGGVYYIAIAGEGINPATSARVGSGSSSFTLTSFGDVSATNLGTVGPVDLISNETLEGGESRFYQFTVPPTSLALEMRLENRVGNPVMAVVTNTTLPDPGGGPNPKDTYGNEGGSNPHDANANILTIANPTNGVYTLAVKARVSGGDYPNASYTLRVRQIPAPELNFTPEFNTNGLSNVGTGQLLNNQRAYYKVVVPTNVNGQPVVGWTLDLAQSSGQATMRVRRDALPSDTVIAMPYTPNAAVVAPPFLTNGTWYVEVRGTNSTTYTLTSTKLDLQRPAWQMPGNGEASTTPGLTAPNFGDSGVDTNGIPLPGDGGIDLELGRYHFYAITVPTNNGGLLRVQLEAISGNPDIYLRTTLPPTATHATNGNVGTMFDRALTSTATEYGNFVPINGTTEIGLQPGIWYFAVRAVANANARYRLKLSMGDVQDLALDGGVAANQALAGGDWRYYRIQVPSDMLNTWSVAFSQEVGDVVMHVRDVTPPGNGKSTAAGDYKDWNSDEKNAGPYSSYDPPGTYVLGVPPVRLGNTYYIGFRAKNDATFSVTSMIGGDTNPIPPAIAFYGGSVTNLIPPFSQVAYRILTPEDALRWRHTSVHSNSVKVFIENGTFPTKTTGDDFRSTVANSSRDVYLVAYPWLPLQTYYLIATNTTGIAQDFTFTMNGSSITADDDNDGLPDAWEIQYFGTISRLPSADTDMDGVSNLNELNEGTNPNDKTSFRARLNLLLTNGVVAINPASSNYALGTVVALTAVPNAGYNFVAWSGAATGSDNPLALTMNTNKTVVPRFRVPGDDFEQRIPLSGHSAAYQLTNVGATKQAGEPNHAGNVGGKSLWWTWTAPASGMVTLSTEGSNFRNSLAAYTGAAVSNLTMVATHLAGVGTNTSQIAFAAVAGTTYHIAVDGFNGDNGHVALTLSLSGESGGAISIGNPVKTGDGYFRFTITSLAGQVLQIDASTNLVTWMAIATVTNVTGTLEFTDTNSPGFMRRYYRVVLPDETSVAMSVSGLQKLMNGALRFTVISSIGQVVRVEASTNMTAWATIGTITNVTGSVQFTDSTATNFSRRFYRTASP